MKARIAPKKRVEQDEESTPSPAKKTGKTPWLLTDPKVIRQETEAAQAESARSNLPELWIFDGNTKQMRIRHNGVLCAVRRYRFKRNGKFLKFTQPDPESVDLFEQAGEQAYLDYVYEVFDYTGYVREKDKKRIKNRAMFWIVGNRLHKQLEVMRQQCGDYRNYDIMVTRVGSGQATSYMITPKPPAKAIPEYYKTPRLADELERYFAPPDEKTQRRVLRMGGGDDEHDD